MAEETNGNGRATIREVYSLVGKVNDKLDALNEKVDKHLVEAARRDERIKKLEDWRVQSGEICALRTRQLIVEEHEARHGDHMAKEHIKTEELLGLGEKEDKKDDPELSSMRVGFRFSKWFAGIAIAALVTTGIGAAVTSYVRANQTDSYAKTLEQQNKVLAAQNEQILKFLEETHPSPTPTTGSN